MRRWAQTYFTGKFFLPDKDFFPPIHYHPVNHENVQFPSKTGGTLTGFFLKAKGPAQGTVVHCHGNSGTTQDHAPLVQFLIDMGYNALVFDYGGYGQSQGHPSPESIINDTRTALDYCRGRSDVDGNKLALFGQSLGGAAAAGAMALEPWVKCLILEGAFTTYRAMAKETFLGKFLFPITPFVIPNTGPLHDLEKTKNRPTLIVHGEIDGVVPVKFGRELHRRFPSSTTLLILKNLRHLEGEELEPLYRQAIMDFLKQHLASNSPAGSAGN